MCAYNKYKSTPTVFAGVFVALTAVCGLLLSAPQTSADSSANVNVSVIVPYVCSLTVSPESISNTIYPGHSELIGTTNIKAVCNDPAGLAVYAVGYTNDTYGNTNLTATMGASSANISTHATASGTPASSEWNMTLSPVSGDYAPTIVTGFDSAHAIPDVYTKVAYRNTMTDMGNNATGANFTAAFNAYIAEDQAAGTYTGKVKFTLVHPAAAEEPVDDDQVAVIYEGNGLTFSGGASTNRVIYSESCEDQYGYIGNTPEILKTVNLDANGTQAEGKSYVDDIPYFEGYYDLGTVDFENADKVKLVINYDISQYSYFRIYDENWETVNDERDGQLGCNIDNADGCSGTVTYVIDGSSASISLDSVNGISPDHNYGVYAMVYPVYNDEYEGATYGVTNNVCTFTAVGGEYAETSAWNGRWDMEVGGYDIRFYDESEVVEYLNQNAEELKGGSIRMVAYYPYKVVYNGNQATVGTMQGFYTIFDSVEESGNLLAPNFLRTGYGFAGWSESPSATANGNDEIYGPTEEVHYSDLTFDANKIATLYAVWVPSTGNLQSWAGCSSMSTGSVTALTDTRDGNTYTVGKYGDGKCWMMENLRLDLTDANTSITANDTNGPTSTFLTLRQAEIGNTLNRKDDCSASGGSSVCGNDEIAYDKGYINSGIAPNPEPRWNSVESKYMAVSWFSYGVLYNWYTATAGNGLSHAQKNSTVNNDICPSGWHLPTGSTDVDGDVMVLMSLFGTVSDYYSNPYSIDGRKVDIVETRPNNIKAFPYNGISYYYLHGDADHWYIQLTDIGGHWGKLGGAIWTSTTGRGNIGEAAILDMAQDELRLVNVFGGQGHYTYPVRCLADSASSSPSNASPSNASPASVSGGASTSNVSPAPLAMQSYSGQTANYGGQGGTSELNDEIEEVEETGTDSGAGNTAPLGVKKTSSETASTVVGDSSSDIYGAVAIAGVATLVGAGIFFGAKKKKEDEEDS